jgi:hypothetical protein
VTATVGRSTGSAIDAVAQDGAASPGAARAGTAPAASSAAGRRRDHLGVHLIGALRGDQVAHLGDDVDIGLFEAALRDAAVAFGIGDAVLRRAGRRRIGVLVAADRLQAGLVDEARQRQLADDARGGRARQRHRDLALRVDGDARRVLRDRNRRLHRVALRGDDAALVVHLEGAVAGVLEGAVRHLDLEEAFAGDRQIEVVAGHRQCALRHRARRADGLDAAAEIDADRQDGALVGGLRADAAHMFVDQVLERRGLLLVAGGAQVRDVVGDHLNVEFLCRHSGRSGVKRLHITYSSICA